MKIKIDNIETERLLLRKYVMDDLDDYVEYRSNSKYYEFLPGEPKKNNDEYKKSLEKFVKGYNKRKEPEMTWAIVLKQENKVVGSISVEKFNEQHKLCEIGWGVSVNYHRKGIAYEAAVALINHLFTNYDLNRIQAFIWQGNKASEALAIKLGFTHEGTNRQARLKNGKFLDILNFGLLRNEWKNLKYNKHYIS